MSNESSVNSTMLEGWPDAIRCGSGEQDGEIYLFHGASSQGGTVSYYAESDSDEHRYVKFNDDASYHSRFDHNNSSVDCVNQSISQLYNSGREFSFLGASTAASTTTDSIQISTTSTTSQEVGYMLSSKAIAAGIMVLALGIGCCVVDRNSASPANQEIGNEMPVIPEGSTGVMGEALEI